MAAKITVTSLRRKTTGVDCSVNLLKAPGEAAAFGFRATEVAERK